MNSWQEHCESTKLENENIVSVILYDATRLTVGDKYRFCLVLVQKKDNQHDLVVGCSNITKLKQIENVLVTDSGAKRPIDETATAQSLSNIENKEVISDISSFEKITDFMDKEPRQTHDQIDNDDFQEYTTIFQSEVAQRASTTLNPSSKTQPMEKAYASLLMNHFNSSLLPSLRALSLIGILLTSIFAFIWAATKFTHYRRSVPSTVCYAASDQHSIDVENSNRYLKLQATTVL